MSERTSPVTTTTDIPSLENRLNEMITSGKALEAFEKFYAEDIVMEEGTEERHEGKDTNREREQEFFGSVEEVHDLRLLSSATEGDVSFSEWKFDVTFKGGNRVQFTQVARRRWEDGQVVHERFYKAS